MLSLDFAVRTDVGLLRPGNEDAAYAGPHLLAVADGMGGHAAGEVASGATIQVLAPLDAASPGDDPAVPLRRAVDAAQLRLREMVGADRSLEGMGTTLTALLAQGDRVVLAHIGDSRAYLLHEGSLERLTHDHTVVQTLIDVGQITPAEAEVHPARNQLTRTLDGQGRVQPDVDVRELRPGDRYLICSDGLSAVVSDQTIRDCLADGAPAETADRLVELALRGGGPDNVTVVVADVVDGEPAAAQPVIAGAAESPQQPARAAEPGAGDRLGGDPHRWFRRRQRSAPPRFAAPPRTAW